MSIGDLGDQLKAMLASLPEAKTNEALTFLEQAQQHIAQATAGSSASEPAEMVQQLGVARKQVREVLRLLQLVRAAVERYIEQAEAHASEISAPVATVESAVAAGEPSRPADRRTAAPVSSTAGGPSSADAPDGQRISRGRAVEVQAELPPPVVSMSGNKTHGRWIDEHGQPQPIVSGEDEDSAEVWRTLQALEIPLPGPPTTVADVEQKLAVRMVREKRKHLEVVINNEPCLGRYGCDVLVPVILPKGYSLTVHGPNYRKMFTGGKKPWWC